MNENEFMLTSALDCRRIDLTLNKGAMTAEQRERYLRMRARRDKGEPVQYIIGQCEFMGIPILTDRRALIPRPETEILVDLTIDKIRFAPHNDDRTALDLGTGTGNIAIALLKNLKNITLTAVDISDEAIDLAFENARRNGVAERCTFLRVDMSAFLKKAKAEKRMYDVIISNPPYVPTQDLEGLPEDVKHEPRLALDGGSDGLEYYRLIIRYASHVLAQDGFLVMEIGDGQRAAIEKIFARYKRFTQVQFFKDYTGTYRIVWAR